MADKSTKDTTSLQGREPAGRARHSEPKGGVHKTNAARILDQLKVAYDLIPYEVDENDLGAQHIADQLCEPIQRLFKTLVLRGDKLGLFVCVIPGAEEVDLKKAARVTGNKKVELIHLKELQPLTGYIRGGCSPIGMKKPLPTWFHQSLMDYDTVYCSAGQRGLQFRLAPADLLRAAHGQLADLTCDSFTEPTP